MTKYCSTGVYNSYINVGLSQHDVKTVQDVGRVEEHWYQADDDHEHGEVDGVVQHGPEAQTDQVPAQNKISPYC